MLPLDLSVMVVSWGRPEALCRCVQALVQQRQAGCEIVVVADQAGLAAVGALPFSGTFKRVAQDQPNISRARNAGLGVAAGQIIAFVDDDAVAEPTWAERICAAFADDDVAAVTGPVLGRNGISVQWGPTIVDDQARDTPIDSIAPIPKGHARKLQGTNMAIRRAAFEQIGGFDEAFRFFLDDTDMAWRLASAGLRSDWVPGAVVHHGFEASARRTATRVPLSLEDIGASTCVYLRKHAGSADHAPILRKLEAAQSSRLLKLTRTRKIDVTTMRRLMESLHDGLRIGADVTIFEPQIPPACEVFTPAVGHNPPEHHVLSGRRFQRHRLRAKAADLVAQGHGVSLFLFEPTPRKHRVRYTNGGWWEQSGGLFGASERHQPWIRYRSFQNRLGEEIRRISDKRGL